MSQAPRRTRLPPDDRRRQLVGIGLAKLVSTPIQDLSVDEVAAEAGISRGLLFHYFPTKRDFYLACLGAAGRRILRTTAPDPELPPEQRLQQMVRLLVEQIDRRRSFYLALLHGLGAADAAVVEVYDSLWAEATDRVMVCLELPEDRVDVVHAWWKYVEDHALTWSQRPPERRTRTLDDLVDHAVAALHVLVTMGRGGVTGPT